MASDNSKMILSPESIRELLRHVAEFVPDSDRVVQFVHPDILLEQIEERLKQGPCLKESSLKDTASFAMKNCLNTSHPFFVNQLYGGVHPIGLTASYIVEKLNTNVITYEVAPVFVLAEMVVLKELRKIFFGDEKGDGIFSPGGSFSNMYGYMLAKFNKFPETKTNGVFGLSPMVIFTSQEAHYSVTKCAHWMGLGTSNVVSIPTNNYGQMIPEELRNAIAKCRSENKIPLAVSATSGTTVLGAFDDLEAISEICKEEGMWLHCDACWGGSFIFSEKLRCQDLKGIEKCDSISWNAHKMLGAPLQCSVFITRHEDILSKCNSLKASYLFQPDKFYPVEYDRCGDKGFQCGRKADAFKLWYMWTSLGTKGFKELVETAEDSAKYFYETIKMRDDFLVHLDRHQCTNVYFWYVPPRLQGQMKDEAWWKNVAQIQVKLKEKMVLDGRMMIGYSPLPHKNIPNAMRLVLPSYPPKTHALMDSMIQLLVEIGQNL